MSDKREITEPNLETVEAKNLARSLREKLVIQIFLCLIMQNPVQWIERRGDER
jgi:hypothetical protein